VPGMFPIAVKLSGRRCLVVGGGNVASRKVSNLLQCEAMVDVISPEFTAELRRLSEQGLITLIQRGFEETDIVGYMMVFAATDDETVNQRIYQICQSNNILVNAVDDPDNCNFFVPATLRRGDLTISISTAGRSPLLARIIREWLEVQFGPEYEEYLELLGNARNMIKQRFPQEKARRRLFDRILELPVLDLLQQGKKEEAKERIMECIYSWPD